MTVSRLAHCRQNVVVEALESSGRRGRVGVARRSQDHRVVEPDPRELGQPRDHLVVRARCREPVDEVVWQLGGCLRRVGAVLVFGG
jgi:hypothetical protein